MRHTLPWWLDIRSRYGLLVSIDGVGPRDCGATTLGVPEARDAPFAPRLVAISGAHAPLAVAYFAGLRNDGPVFNAIGFSACRDGGRYRVHKPQTLGLVPLALGQALFVSGDVLAYNYRALFGIALPIPSIADLFYLASTRSPSRACWC